MPFGSKIFELARDELAKRKSKAEMTQREHRDAFAAMRPQYLEIEKKMKESAFGVLKVIGMGENAAEYIEKLRDCNLKAQSDIASLLKDAGLPEDYLETPYTCKKCSDSGFFEGKICTCHKQLLKHIAMEQLSKTSPLKLSSFDDFDLSYYEGNDRVIMSKIFNYCVSYAEDFGMDSYSIIMRGETGLGKTHLSLAIAGEAIKKGYNVIYGSAQSFFSRIENEHFNRFKSDENTEEIITDSDLLIIDDLGAEFSTSFTVSVFYNIVNNRMLTGKPTIISTNLTPAQLEKRYSRRVTSRLISEYQALNFVGKDIRQLKK